MRPTRFVAALLAAVTVLAACGDDADQEAAIEIEGLELLPDLPTDHVEGDIDYDTRPPAGGVHNPVWLDCGVYDEQVPEENAVHSLEHGAVWLTYVPAEVSEDDVATLVALHDAFPDRIIVSPFPGVDSPIVAVAWERRLEVDEGDDPRLQAFVDAFVNGPEAPEPGASCSGGIG
jgi:hypothetical protein